MALKLTKGRVRPEEQSLTIDIFEQLQIYYNNWLLSAKDSNTNVIIVEADDIQSVNVEELYEKIRILQLYTFINKSRLLEYTKNSMKPRVFIFGSSHAARIKRSVLTNNKITSKYNILSETKPGAKFLDLQFPTILDTFESNDFLIIQLFATI